MQIRGRGTSATAESTAGSPVAVWIARRGPDGAVTPRLPDWWDGGGAELSEVVLAAVVLSDAVAERRKPRSVERTPGR